MSSHFRPPPSRSASKATPTTLCQKCLKRGHYSYECKTGAQQRPYVARPSRSQLLRNPKLAPKLTSDTPNPLLNSHGVADRELAERRAQREAQRLQSTSPPPRHTSSRKRTRSMSEASHSTVSTNRSPSPPPLSIQRSGDEYMTSQNEPSPPTDGRKRPRSPSSQRVTDSDSDDDRNTRRRRNARSPEHRGRVRQRNSPEEVERWHRRDYTPDHNSNRSRQQRRRSSVSPDRRGTSRRHRDDSASRQKSSYEPGGHAGAGSRHRSISPIQHDSHGNGTPPPPGRRRLSGGNRQRSLSPYSRRLQMTRQLGRQ